jgi:hypothetical protein
MTRKFAAAVAAIGLSLGGVAAEATPITVDFTVTSNELSNPAYGAGVVGTGYFTFDDSLIPAGGTGRLGNPIVSLPTLDLFFDWFGVTFDESNAQIAILTFVDGVLTDWTIGGSYLPASCGFLRYACTSSGGAAPDFDGFASGGIAMTEAKRPGLAYGRPVQWSVRDASVPEPGTLALFGMSALGLALLRRGQVA